MRFLKHESEPTTTPSPFEQELSSSEPSDTQTAIQISTKRSLKFSPAEADPSLKLTPEATASVDKFLKIIGTATTDSITSYHDIDRPEIQDRLNKLNQKLNQGAIARLRWDGGITGGYFGSPWQKDDNEPTGKKLDLNSIDTERWSRYAKWGNRGLNEYDSTPVSQEEQADLLRGYLAAELANGMVNKRDFQGEGAFITLRLIAKVENVDPKTIAQSYSQAFEESRQLLKNAKQQQEFDTNLAELSTTHD